MLRLTDKELFGRLHSPVFRVPFMVLFFQVVFTNQPLQAQLYKNDSLTLVKTLNQAHEFLVKHDYAQALHVAQESLDIAMRIDAKWGQINSLLILAQAQKSLSHYPSSLNYYLQALPEIEKGNDRKTLIWINVKMGELFQEWGVPEKALPHYTTALTLRSKQNLEPGTQLLEQIADTHLSLQQKEKSLETLLQLLNILKKSQDKISLRRILEKTAHIYSLFKDQENSLKYNLQLLEINRDMNDTTAVSATLNVIGNQYKDLNNLNKALEYYQEALFLNKLTRSENNIITNLINIGSVYQSRGDSRDAIRTFTEALDIKKKAGSTLEIAVMHNYLASLYLSQGNLADAQRHTQLSIGFLSGTDNKRLLARNYKRLSEIEEKQANYQEALRSYQQYSLVKDSLLYQEQLAQEKEKTKEFIIDATEKETKLSLIDQEMQALVLRNEKAMLEQERQKIALLLKEKEIQNISLQKEQLEQARAVQVLQLQQSRIEKEKKQQEIVLLEQRRDLQNVALERNERREVERQKEIKFKNTTLALQQAQLERATIQQRYLLYTATLFLVVLLLILVGYFIKRKDNKKLQIQFEEINKQKKQIEQINKSLVELNEEKNDLIGIVAHDLKSPLNQISGMLEIIKLTIKGDTPEQQDYLQRIEQSTNRLKKMVSKILDVSAIEAQTLNLASEQIDLTLLVEEIATRFIELAARKEITIQKKFENNIPLILGDSGYVSEVVENLLSNAVKYSPLGKEIIIRISRQHAFNRVEFIDQGQGISEKDMKNLFGKYRKLSARPTAGEDSTGLGLSIVKKYVLALNGKVWCESVEGIGSNFIVELPIS